jgi:hypothetical protein
VERNIFDNLSLLNAFATALLTLLGAACEELDMNDNANPTPQPGEPTRCFARVAWSTI